jgi:ATP-dependent exoDNAse (exonuclease V) alpha subunit
VNEDTVAGIKKNSMEAALIRETKLILWDEALMQHRHVFDAVNRSLQDIREDNRLFGGMTVVFGGDYQQILPVIVKGSRGDIVNASLMASPMWQELQVLKLQTNMRVGQDEEERAFATWLTDIGHGRHTDETGNVELLPQFSCPENTLESLIQEIYPGIGQLPLPGDHFFAERAILASRNAEVEEVNKLILERFPGDVKVFNSADSIVRDDNVDGELLYPSEFLNSISTSGLPLAKLELKVGCPVMVLRNMDPANGVCNGTRAIVTRMSNRVLEIRLISGRDAGKTHFLPRIKMNATGIELPFPMQRVQFPVRLGFSMTVNKAQGQSLKFVGLDFRSPVFTHGQFYVAVSRATSVHRVRAIWDPNGRERVTKNIVYQEVLQ